MLTEPTVNVRPAIVICVGSTGQQVRVELEDRQELRYGFKARFPPHAEELVHYIATPTELISDSPENGHQATDDSVEGKQQPTKSDEDTSERALLDYDSVLGL